MEDVKTTYTCAICGKKYNSIKDRMICESHCVEEQERKKKVEEAERKQAEQQIRKAEVDKAYKIYQQLHKAYMEDYEPVRRINIDDSSLYDLLRMLP